MSPNHLVQNASDLTTTVTDAVGDAWTSGSHLARDLASTAAERAADVGGVLGSTASSAVHQAPEIPERVVGLVGSARRRWRPPPARRVNRWWFAGAAVALVVAMAWWMRRPTRHDPATDRGPAASAHPVGDHTARATAAAVG